MPYNPLVFLIYLNVFIHLVQSVLFLCETFKTPISYSFYIIIIVLFCAHSHCSAAVSSAYDSRHTHCSTAVSSTYDGRRTMNKKAE